MISAISGTGDALIRIRALRPFVVLFLLMLALLLCCAQAEAHATLTSTVPVDGAVLTEPPKAVTLSFNEPVSPIAATLILPGGQTVTLYGYTVTGRAISIALPTQLGEGSHALSWRAVSEDGHPIVGTTFFVVGSPSAVPASAVPAQTPGVAALLWTARLVLYVGLFFGAAGAAFRLLAELPRGAAITAQWAIVAGLVAVPAALGLQGLDLLGGDLSQLGQAQTWRQGVTSPYSVTLGFAAAALLLGLAAIRIRVRTTARILAGLAIVLSGMAIAASGHASVADPQWLMRPALVVHVTTIAWWVGALFPLIALLRQDPLFSAPPLIAFSRAIPFAIVPLIGSGVILAMVQLGPPGPSWWSAYGQILAAKLTLLFALFAIASWNRWVLTAPAAKGNGRAIRHMRRGIIAEIIIILAVLGLVSAWRFTPPPRALAIEVGTPVNLSLANSSANARVTLSSNRVGLVDVGIELSSASGEPLSPRSVKLSLEPENDTMSPIARAAEALATGEWNVDELAIPLAGVWLVEIEIRVSDFELSKFRGALEIMPLHADTALNERTGLMAR